MESNENNWTLGEIVNLPRQEKGLKSGFTSYVHYIASRYICIREATEGRQRGILVKVLGKFFGGQVEIVNGKPFCKDEHMESFDGDRFYGYPFPSAREVQEVLEILKWNQDLVNKFEDASMHVNPDSTFWISDTTRNKLFLKKLQVLSARDGQICPANDDGQYYRLSVVYFYKGSLVW